MNPLTLFQDSDKLLIGALLYLLWKQQADPVLLLALIFVLIA